MKENEYINYISHAYKQEKIYSQYFSPFDNIKKGTKELREWKLPLQISMGEYEASIGIAPPIKKPYRIYVMKIMAKHMWASIHEYAKILLTYMKIMRTHINMSIWK